MSNQNNNFQLNNNLLRKIIVSTILPISLYVNPITSNQFSNLFTIQPANAEFRAQQKRSYFRFIPKLITGLNFYKTELKAAIDTEDWPKIEKIFEVVVTKYNKNDPTQVDATDTYVNKYFYRPMTIFAGTFAEKGVSPKQQALMTQEAAFEAEMFKLEGCIKDQKGEGFFAPDIKMPTGPARKYQAEEAWLNGKEALNKYIQIANDGLMFELNKINEI